MDIIVQVGLSGTPEQNSKNPANQDEVLTVDFNFLNVKLNKQKTLIKIKWELQTDFSTPQGRKL